MCIGSRRIKPPHSRIQWNVNVTYIPELYVTDTGVSHWSYSLRKAHTYIHHIMTSENHDVEMKPYC